MDQSDQDNQPNMVTIQGHAFIPASLQIKRGETVTWVNNDEDKHTVTSSPDGQDFDSGPFTQGNSYSHAFERAGQYSYHCSLHPEMKGTITVE